jgi:hypothetical protein
VARRCLGDCNPIKTISTIWEQWFDTAEHLRMDWNIKKWLHNSELWIKPVIQSKCWVVLCCCMIIPIPMPTLMKSYRNSSSMQCTLALSDYHLFGPFKEALGDHHSPRAKTWSEVVQVQLSAQPKTFFSKDTRKLVQQWTKCVQKQERLC